MDSEELDRWLDADLSAGPGSDDSDDVWPATANRDRVTEHQSSDRVVGARRPWKWIAAAGLVGWLVVMALAADGNEESRDSDGVGSAEATTPGFVSSVPTPTDIPAAPSEGPAPIATDPTATALAATGPATAALRARLTATTSGASYLEWATVVDVIPMGAGIDLVVIDAIWLEGQDPTSLDQAHQSRWAVPVADDGEVLASPWPHSPSPEQTRDATAPPVGTVRIGEVAQGLMAAGWTEATVIGSDPHPLLGDAVTALVEGVPPGGGDVVSEVVWLQEDDDGMLRVPGSATVSAAEQAGAGPEPTTSATSQKGTSGELR